MKIQIILLFFLLPVAVLAQNNTELLESAQAEKDPEKAILLYTKSILHYEENSSELRDSYFGRGLKKYELKQFNGAVADLEKSLSINVLKSESYLDIDIGGYVYETETICYLYLALAYHDLEDKINCCYYLKKTSERGVETASYGLSAYCK